MVDVPVKDEHLFTLVDCVLSCDSHIVKEAESMDIFAMCMVAWRSDNAISSVVLPAQNFIHGSQTSLR